MARVSNVGHILTIFVCLSRLLVEEMTKWPLQQSLKPEMICVSKEFFNVLLLRNGELIWDNLLTLPP